MEQGGMNSVVMSIRGLPSLELWVPTLPVVPVSSGRNQMVPGGSGGSGGSGDSEIVGFDWSYQSRIQKWYFVRGINGIPPRKSICRGHFCSRGDLPNDVEVL